jgi:hypothetical protein
MDIIQFKLDFLFVDRLPRVAIADMKTRLLRIELQGTH